MINISEIQEEIRKSYRDVESIKSKNRLAFLQSISCRQEFFPEMKVKSNFDHFLNAKINQRLAFHDLLNFEKIEDNIELSTYSHLTNSPKIYCPFHFGSYRILSCVLHQNDIDFAVVANSIFIKESGKQMMEMHNNQLSVSGKKLEFELIDANSNSGIRKMIRSLRNGKSLIIYVDGGNGVAGLNIDKQKAAKIKFLEKDIYSRIGAAYLANHEEVPLIPVLSGRSKIKNKISLQFFKEVHSPHSDMKTLTKTMQTIWNIFEEEVAKDPLQWEGLLYAHHFIETERSGLNKTIDKKGKYLFNNQNYDFFIDNEMYHLYGIKTFETIKISEQIFKLLVLLTESSYEYSKLEKVIPAALFNDLLNQNILIQENEEL